MKDDRSKRRTADNTDERADIHYNGNALLRILGYIKPFRKQFFFSILLAGAITLLELWKPIIIGDAIDKWITGSWAAGEAADLRFAGILKAAALYIAVLAAYFVCDRLQFLLMQKTGQDIVYNMRNELFGHIENLDMRYFDVTPVGKIVTRVTNDIESLNQVFSNILVKLFKNIALVIGLAVIMLTLNVRMALFSFIMLPVVTALTVLFRMLSRRAYRITRTRLTAINTYLSEHISGMKVIQVFGREQRKYEEFQEQNERLYDAGWREMMIYAIFRPGIYLTSVVALAIVLLGGASGALGEVITIGTMYVFVQYIQTFFQPIQELAEVFSSLQNAIASAEKVFTLLDEQPKITEPEHPAAPETIRGRIEFDHVWFAYKNEDWVLKDVSFIIEPGQKVAFVGATGAGKSSILNLIGRYYDIQKGRILIDGIDIKTMSRDRLRRAIGQVQQDVFLFTGDVSTNIRLRDDSITDEQVQAAAREVNADRFIRHLPLKYASPVAERGATFSAGQRQLISFARTLAYDPAILILDEATANIDTETEQWIQEAVERLMRGRTTIMVAHRLSTIQHADCIIVMHHGRVREQGTHQELLAQDGIYKKLYQLQLA